MKKIGVTIIVVFLFCKAVYAEEMPKKYSHSVYLGFLGTGGLGSINYACSRFLKHKFAVGMSGGFGTEHIRDYRLKFNPDLIFPFSIYLLYGDMHQIKFGIGQTLSSIPAADMQAVPIHTRILESSTTFAFGYRFNHTKTGLFFGCAYTPIIGNDNYYKYWGGLSIGYVFK